MIIDPGQDAEAGIAEILAEHRLSRWRSCSPTATSTTSGRWRRYAAPGTSRAYIHPSDRALLSDPARGLRPAGGAAAVRGLTFTEPDDVAELADGMTVRLAGVELDG